ncbi:cytosine deaminase [Thermocoleostomius sinensis]|jgi:cytosine deaminase|uniref:Cytosine deaminase n=1 Tax=Thermocoleostomius sinensis A174 TaxID=2016057 RepID=A0A9E8ZDX1_9CYAN|nr:cytosine deaminase [Thermocoleostomius sinensis]WAL60119.1 cytosine deaminase [Thermocoleostomius sinensis A174]
MVNRFFDFPGSTHYWLTNAHVPVALLEEPSLTQTLQSTRDGLVCVSLEVESGRIVQIQPNTIAVPASVPAIDLQRRIVFPCFVDMHTHLDKGHTWERSPNLAGTFDHALTVVQKDSEQYWNADDVFRRMEFGLKCSYAHGTKALRTHIDAFGNQADISLEVFQSLRDEWRDRLTLQAVSLVSLDYFQTPQGEKLADQIAEVGGLLGGLPMMSEELDKQLDRVFELAKERNLDLDFHTDESGNPNTITLRRVAAAALRHDFPGQIVCGHCCSLAVQSPTEIMKTLTLVKQAGIGIVSLPMCNLYLQDRNQSASWGWIQDGETNRSASNPDASRLASFPSLTPRWRGVTLLHELKHQGIPVAVASDNCRDPFYAFGDHDVLEVYTQATRIEHLDAPYGDWCCTVTMTPADLMGLSEAGRIAASQPADLIVFKARYYSELFSRSQHDRIVLRNGQPIDTTLPDYSELDDLLQLS